MTRFRAVLAALIWIPFALAFPAKGAGNAEPLFVGKEPWIPFHTETFSNVFRLPIVLLNPDVERRIFDESFSKAEFLFDSVGRDGLSLDQIASVLSTMDLWTKSTEASGRSRVERVERVEWVEWVEWVKYIPQIEEGIFSSLAEILGPEKFSIERLHPPDRPEREDYNLHGDLRVTLEKVKIEPWWLRGFHLQIL